MKLLNHELKLSISLDEKTCVNRQGLLRCRLRGRGVRSAGGLLRAGGSVHLPALSGEGLPGHRGGGAEDHHLPSALRNILGHLLAGRGRPHRGGGGQRGAAQGRSRPMRARTSSSIPASSPSPRRRARRTSPPAGRVSRSWGPSRRNAERRSRWRTCREPVWAARRRKWCV